MTGKAEKAQIEYRAGALKPIDRANQTIWGSQNGVYPLNDTISSKNDQAVQSIYGSWCESGLDNRTFYSNPLLEQPKSEDPNPQLDRWTLGVMTAGSTGQKYSRFSYSNNDAIAPSAASAEVDATVITDQGVGGISNDKSGLADALAKISEHLATCIGKPELSARRRLEDYRGEQSVTPSWDNMQARFNRMNESLRRKTGGAGKKDVITLHNLAYKLYERGGHAFIKPLDPRSDEELSKEIRITQQEYDDCARVVLAAQGNVDLLSSEGDGSISYNVRRIADPAGVLVVEWESLDAEKYNAVVASDSHLHGLRNRYLHDH